MRKIVVGVDGSEVSRRALRWAAEEATARGAPLEVVYGYPPAAPPGDARYSASMHREQVEELRRERDEAQGHAMRRAQSLVDGLVRQLEDDEGLDATALDITALAVHSRRPAQMLIERSQEADLLVVGSRGRGGFAGLLLGSTGQQCAAHAHCTVVVIRPEGPTG